MQWIMRAWKQLVILLAIALLTTSCKAFLPILSDNPWEIISLPVEENLLDISFTGDKAHGWLVGTNS